MSSIFDILGPVMVGPSSSHTAGAVRIGYTARQLFGEPVKKAIVYLHGSFAATGEGHGTDKAIIAGLLGMKPDDLRIPDSFTVAKESGMEFVIDKKEIRGAHPNTARIIMENDADKKIYIQSAFQMDADKKESSELASLILTKDFFKKSSFAWISLITSMMTTESSIAI